ncbi:MAG: hypothetical protein ABW168_08895 [Sedimenticola sp.]
MKRLLAGITASLLLAAPALQAQELTETLPMAYFNLPFGSTHKASEPVYGLRLTQAGVDTQGGLNIFQSERPALMDFQMKNGEVNAFTVNGLNALTKTEVVYADGSTGTETGLSTEAIVLGVAVGGFIIYKTTEDDDSATAAAADSEGDGSGSEE